MSAIVKTSVSACLHVFANVFEDANRKVDILRVVHMDQRGRHSIALGKLDHVFLGKGIVHRCLSIRGSSARCETNASTAGLGVGVEVFLSELEHTILGRVDGLLLMTLLHTR